jgi:hypothetical protein
MKTNNKSAIWRCSSHIEGDVLQINDLMQEGFAGLQRFGSLGKALSSKVELLGLVHPFFIFCLNNYFNQRGACFLLTTCTHELYSSTSFWDGLLVSGVSCFGFSYWLTIQVCLF